MSTLKMSVPTVFIRTAYNYDRNAESDASALVCNDPTRAQQQFKDETDINTLVRRFGVTGKIPIAPLPPQYGDFTGISDFHTAVNAIAAANEAFDALPSNVRARFQNDPGQFVDFSTNPANRAELEKLGLLIPPPAPAYTGPLGGPASPPAGIPAASPSPAPAPAAPSAPPGA